MRAFILPGTVPEDWDYVCEVSWGRRVPPLVQLWGIHRVGTERTAGIMGRQHASCSPWWVEWSRE